MAQKPFLYPQVMGPVLTQLTKAQVDTRGSAYCKNIYVDLDGHLRPGAFPATGLWRFDGQVFYLDKSKERA